MKPIVQFENVSKSYHLGLTRESIPTVVTRSLRGVFSDGRPLQTREVLWAIRDMSFELQPGESLALVGANGAGKSTALKLLSRITAPTEGRIRVNGRLSALLELGAGFHPDLTGRENIFLNGSILGLSRSYIAKRLDEIVAFAELEKFIDTPLKRYSSGMSVRLGFAVASFTSPDILLIDEVLAVGDSRFRQKCMARIQELLDNGVGIIFVSHNLYMVQAVCRSALYVKEGSIARRGDVASVVSAYEADIHQARTEDFSLGAIGQAHNRQAAVTITKVEVLCGDGELIGGLRSDQSATVRIHCFAKAATSSFNLVVFLIRSDGVTCTMIRSKVDKVRLSLDAGVGVVDLKLDPLRLATGSYFAEVEITDAADAVLIHEHPARSDWFTVAGRVLNSDVRSVVFEPDAEWRMGLTNGNASVESNSLPEIVQ